MLAAGLISLVAFMLIVMGVPLVNFLKRDMRWNQLPEKTPQAWYDL